MIYLITFMEGVITFISPCLLPMLPLYILYFTGDDQNRSKQSVLFKALTFVLGFTIVFTLLGAFAGTIGVYLMVYQYYLNIILGSIVILFGLNILGVIKIKGFTLSNSFKPKQNMSYLKTLLFGMVFALGWTPCVGAFLGSALLLASQQASVVKGMLMLLLYSLGLGIPFVLSAVLIDQMKNTFVLLKKNLVLINKISGIFLIIMGILMITGIMSRLLTLLSF